MARILGLAGSGGALRWALAGEVKIRIAQSREEKRMVPRRMVDLQLGRSSAAPLHDTGFGDGASRISRRVSHWRSMLRRHKGNCSGNSSAAKAEQPMRFFCRSKSSDPLNEGGDAGDALADYELVDVVGAFVGRDA